MVPGSDVSFFEVFGERVRRRKFCLLARRGCAITDPTMATGRAASCHKAHLVEEVEEMLRTQIDTNGTVVNFVRHLELSLTRKGGRDIVGVENDWRGCERKELRGWEDGQIVVGFRYRCRNSFPPSQNFCDFFFGPLTSQGPDFFHSLALASHSQTSGVTEPKEGRGSTLVFIRHKYSLRFQA